MKSPDAETDTIRLALARFKVSKAMILVESAQSELGRACEELSSIQHGHPAQKRVRALYDRAHAEWYRLQRLFEDQRIRIDRDPTDDERARFGGDGA